MPIRPFLAGQVFDPKAIAEMSAALEGTCEIMGLRVVDDAMTRLVAQAIIGLAQRGIKGAEELQRQALAEIKATD